MNKSQTLAMIVIVAAVAVGASVFIATGMSKGQGVTATAQSTLNGLEQEQKSSAIPGNQPSDNPANATGTQSQNSPANQGAYTASSGSNSTNANSTQSGNSSKVTTSSDNTGIGNSDVGSSSLPANKG